MLLPSSINGVLYRIGPAKFHRGGQKCAHVLDGDGKIDRIEIRHGLVFSIKSRFVETPQFLHEEREDRYIYRGAFGTAPHVSLRKMKLPANTALIHHNKTLLAMWEGSYAIQVDAETLAYRAPFNFGGAARVAPAFAVHPLLDRALGIGGDAIGAHAQVCPSTGNLVVMMTKFGLENTFIRFIEFARDSWKVVRVAAYSVKGMTHVHSFGITEKSLVFFQPEITFNTHGFRRGLSALEAVNQSKGPLKLVELPRNGGSARFTLLPRAYVTHITNAYDTSEGPELDYFATDYLGQNMSMDLAPWHLKAGARAPVRMDMQVSEFPVVNPSMMGACSRYYFYTGSLLNHSPLDSWVKMDRFTGVRKHCASPGSVHTECAYIATGESEEDHGVLLGVVFVGKQGELRPPLTPGPAFW